MKFKYNENIIADIEGETWDKFMARNNIKLFFNSIKQEWEFLTLDYLNKFR